MKREFIPVQVNLTQEQIDYLEKIRNVDGIRRGPYIRLLLKRDMENSNAGLSVFEQVSEQVVTSTVKRKTLHRRHVEPKHMELMSELKQVLEARKKKLEPLVVF